MPRKNSVKHYFENGCYHIYNRGVEERAIFQDDQDYKTFLYFNKYYLDAACKIHPKTGLPNLKNLSDEVDLLAYCLMPNHFHLLLRQITSDGISKLMQRLCTNYVMYFNKRYDRVGPLFQGIYKGVLVKTDEQLLHVSRYIHRNPISMRVEPSRGFNPFAYPYSSYGNYLGIRTSLWVKPQIILQCFNQYSEAAQLLSYREFVEYENENNSLNDELAIDS